MDPRSATITPRTDAVALAARLINSNLIALALAEHDRLLFANMAFHRLFGRPDGLADLSLPDLLLPEYRETIATALLAENTPPPVIIAEAFRGDTTTFEVELRFERMMADDGPVHAIFAQDVTDRFRAEAQLNLLAYSDPLTGLGNRAMLADRLRQAMLATRGSGKSFAVLVLDLDEFKQINDRFGHASGDLVLQRIAARLLASMRDTDTVVRLGGDEFAVVIPDLKARGDAMAVADRLVNLAGQPILIGTTDVQVGGSAGIAIYPEHAATVDQLLAAADRALYAAKRRGRNRAAWATAAGTAETVPAPLLWNAAHETGAREIDEQHARLVSLLNELIGTLRNGAPYEDALARVVSYTGFHFATEERLMRDCCYGGMVAHRDMHRRLLDDLRGLRMDGAHMSVALIARYLQEWLLRHVDGADRDLAAALLAFEAE